MPPTPPSTIRRLPETSKKAPPSSSKTINKPTNIPASDKAPRYTSNAGIKKTVGPSRLKQSAVGKLPESTPRRVRDPELTSMLLAEDIQVYVPGELEYERAVASSNLLYRFSRPTYVIRPKTTDQVVSVVTEAVHRKIPITIKNGGHSYIGSSFPNDGIMLDLKEMNKVTLDKYVSKLS